MTEGQRGGIEGSFSNLGNGVSSRQEITQSGGSDHPITPGGRLRQFGSILLEVWGCSDGF